MRRTLTAEQKETARALRGKTMVRVYLYPFNPNREASHVHKELATDPVILFNDGARLHFVVEETEGSEYGVGLVLRSK